ncbi:hypothetical protein [Heyndrickxia camelliae]|uniref:Uncharacterized protein n=1 Tax=Heyndrickxia camelliae TaxID=1707093 RepID=A0A2N3LG74_9BACI|nr:hypothetical protein [Heyndrickxia camelliae]PKR83567.1 hypothetical protein CWO92_18555 [Heyndrickxia camelliae]
MKTTKIIQGKEYKVLEVVDYGEYTITFVDHSDVKNDVDQVHRFLAELLYEQELRKSPSSS